MKSRHKDSMSGDLPRLPGLTLALFALFALAAGLAACEGCEGGDAPGDAGSGPGTGGAEGGVPPAGVVDGGSAGDGGSLAPLRLEIEPNPAELEATVGGNETLPLRAVWVERDGSRRDAQAAFWASLNPEIGVVDSAGVFTPSRERAGSARVRVRADGVEAAGAVRVVLREASAPDGAGVDPGHFDGPQAAAGTLRVLYPEDGVVIPANLAPLLFQWEKSRRHARLTLSGAHGSLVLYTEGDRVQPERSSWRRFLVAHVGESISLTLEESEGAGTERQVTTQTLHLADADLRSTVYYWAVDQGRIVRIDADSIAPTVLDIPYESGPGSGAGGAEDVNCRACHALSADGQHMAFTYFSGNGPGGVVDPGALGAPILPNRDERRWNFAALSPDGSLLLANYQNRISVRSGYTGEMLVPDITGFDVAQPAFSPLGNRVAFAGQTRMNGSSPGWEIDFNRSALFIADIDALAGSVSGVRQVVPDEGEALYYPSFNPDGRLLAYTKGPHSRSAVSGASIPGDLYLAAVHAAAGSEDVPRVLLARANPGSNSYLPTFNPRVEGGYQWVAFYSRRDYGHVLRGADRPQIWVAAIDAAADPAASLADPSHPAFWLPGQNVDTENLSSFFAPRPCSNAGGECDSDGACCDDLLCRPTGGAFQCVAPAEACLLTGTACGDDESCCEGLLCGLAPGAVARTCLPPGQVCSEAQQVCEFDADCCDGSLVCAADEQGVSRCLSTDALPCAQVGQGCDNRACCAGAGQCLSGMCVIVGG